MQRLSALDAAFLSMETDEQPLHVGSLLVVEGPAPSSGELLDRLAERVAQVPACHRRVQRSAAGLRRPVWVDDDRFSLERHVHRIALPPSAGTAELRRLVVELMARRLDTTVPLWEVWQVDGLPDDGWVLFVKAHHTMVDGFVGAGLLTSLLSADGVGSPGPPPSSAPAPVEHVTVRDRFRLLRQGVRTVAVPDLPPNALGGPLGRDRGWGWIGAGLADLAVVAERAGCTVNDVYLGVLAGAYRNALLAHGQLDAGTRLRVIVPVSMRTGPDDSRTGNIDAAFFVDLPVHEPDAAARLADIASQAVTAKTGGVARATEALVRAADHVPMPLLDRASRAYVRRGQRRVNVAASDVRGPGAPLSVGGRRVRDIVPVVPLALEVRTTSALLSYAGRVTISVTADAAAFPDVDELVAALEESLAETLAL